MGAVLVSMVLDMDGSLSCCFASYRYLSQIWMRRLLRPRLNTDKRSDSSMMWPSQSAPQVAKHGADKRWRRWGGRVEQQRVAESSDRLRLI